MRNSSEPSGTASYSPEEFAEFLRTGTAKGGRELPMMSGVARGRLKHLREEEMVSLHAYLRELED